MTIFCAVSFFSIEATTDDRQYSRHKRIIDSSLFYFINVFENGMHLMSLVFLHTHTILCIVACAVTFCSQTDATIKENKKTKKMISMSVERNKNAILFQLCGVIACIVKGSRRKLMKEKKVPNNYYRISFEMECNTVGMSEREREKSSKCLLTSGTLIFSQTHIIQCPVHLAFQFFFFAQVSDYSMLLSILCCCAARTVSQNVN